MAITLGLTSIVASAGATRGGSGSGSHNTFSTHSHVSNMSFHGNANIGHASISRDSGVARSQNGSMTHAVTPATKTYSRNFTSKNGSSYTASGNFTTGTKTVVHSGTTTNNTTGKIVHAGDTALSQELSSGHAGIEHDGFAQGNGNLHQGNTSITRGTTGTMVVQHQSSGNTSTISHSGVTEFTNNTAVPTGGEHHGTTSGKNATRNADTVYYQGGANNQHSATITPKK